MPQVKLIVGRTGIGNPGDIVEYDAKLAADHVSRGLVSYVEDVEAEDVGDETPKPKATAKPKAETKPRKGQGKTDTAGEDADGK